MRGDALNNRRDIRNGVVALALTATGMAVAACAPNADPVGRAPAGLATNDLSEATLAKFASYMDPAMRSLALRHDPGLRRADLWNRPEGWASLDIGDVPDLGFGTQDGATAEDMNELRPFSDLPIRPMKPFVLKAGTEDRKRALQCLTEAVYYEAAREPGVGQEAVAQVVLNRVRHPAYPKSVCGVVYQGSARATGCQFTFTCDGSLRWAPEPALWRQAQRVAERALSGHVAKSVGSATHYHAAYVAPYWAPTLVKMTQVGAHIFYRWTGPWGEPPAFTGRYAGREAYLSPTILGGVDQRTQGGLLSPEAQGVPAERKVTLAVAGEVRTYTVADATAKGGERTRVLGTIAPARRKATADEIREINQKLEAFDKGLETPAAAGAPPA
ncbi:cell wall hydrolase [Phenylobacterium sp. VNQ135]|uniref:cell wall hydrolase n=1 Tax=Phenylobacterium sp. VNQ135 TaxID=3400922 RepID=UPI003C0F55A8